MAPFVCVLLNRIGFRMLSRGLIYLIIWLAKIECELWLAVWLLGQQAPIGHVRGIYSPADLQLAGVSLLKFGRLFSFFVYRFLKLKSLFNVLLAELAVRIFSGDSKSNADRLSK